MALTRRSEHRRYNMGQNFTNSFRPTFRCGGGDKIETAKVQVMGAR